jgi:hypothetical protein
LCLYLIFLQRILHIHKIRTLSCVRDGRWEMGEENERKKKV